MSDTTAIPPVEGTVVYDGPVYEPTPMSKTEAGVLIAFGAAFLGGLGWLIKKDMEAEKIRQDELKLETEERNRKAAEARAAREAWYDTQRAEGKIVIETNDRRLIAIPAEAYAKSVVKKKGEWA